MRVPKLSTVAVVVTIVVGALTILGGTTYVVLMSYSQHFYGELGMSSSDLGISRTRLIEETTGGTLVWVILIPLAVALIYGIIFFLCLEVIPRIAFLVWRWLPLRADSWLAEKRRTTRGPERVNWTLLLQISGALVAVSVVLFAVGLWIAAGQGAKTIRNGGPYSGEVFAGLLALDVHASPYRFTRVASNHNFDRGCVLYLGRANGNLVFYDTQHGRPLPLPESEYAGHALPGHAGPPPRCEDRDDGLRPVLDGGEVEDVDVAGGVRLWAQRSRPSGPWVLLARRGGHTRMLARSPQPLWPDLGRDTRGALVVDYRRCGPGTPCVLRERSLSNGHATTVATPRLQGCEPQRAVRSAEILAVVVGGPACSSSARGVWTRLTGRSWQRMTGSGAASGDLDAFGPMVAWVERRGPLLRLRVVGGKRAWTAFEDDTGLDGSLSYISSVRVVSGGVLWASAQTDRGEATLMSRAFGSGTCRTHGELPTGHDGAGHFAPEAGDVLVGTPRGLAEREGGLILGAGDRLAADRGLAGRSCPSSPDARQPSAFSLSLP